MEGEPGERRGPRHPSPRWVRAVDRPRGGPAEPGAPVALARPGFGDAQWSYLYKARDTDYAGAEPAPG